MPKHRNIETPTIRVDGVLKLEQEVIPGAFLRQPG
jgi:hypothetical protein